jgi:hypothetical protein
VNGLPAADRAAVEEVAVLEDLHAELGDRHRRVLPDPQEIDELEVDHLGAALLCEFQCIRWSHFSSPVPMVLVGGSRKFSASLEAREQRIL